MMKKTILFMFFCGLLAAHADFVYQSGSRFTTTADMDGDGRSDLVLVDGSNATVRIGYQLSANSFTWADPRPLGLNNVTGVACGTVLSTSSDALVATSPDLNRINIYEAPSAAAVLSPVAVYGNGIGPFSVAAMDIGGSGNTAHDDLLATSLYNGTNSYRLERFRANGTSIAPLAGMSTIGSAWSRMNEVDYAPGQTALAVVDHLGTGFLRMYDLSTGWPSHLDSIGLSGISDPRYVCLPTASDEAHFILWEKGGTNAWTTTLEPDGSGGFQFSPLEMHPYSAPVEDMFVLQGALSNRLAVVTSGGAALDLLDYDDYGGPALIQTLSPPAGERFQGVAPIGLDDLIVFSSTGANAAPTANQMHFSGGQFVTLGSRKLGSPRSPGGANVMTFAGEPFVTNMPQRLQLLRAPDWASGSSVSGSVTADAETDTGLEFGLRNKHPVSLGAADPSAAYTLDNQPHPSISIHAFEAARGEEVATLTIDPGPGTYGTSIGVSLSSAPAVAIYYRTDLSGAWTLYSAPFTLFADTDVQYYAEAGGKSSVIRTAGYRFTDSPSALDSDGDGVPDYVEIANGLDPIESGLDSDGDGYSDLDELLAGTDPTNAASRATGRIEQDSVYDLVLTPRLRDGVAGTADKIAVGTQVRLFSASGGLRSYAKTTNLTLSVATDNPAAYFPALSRSAASPFLTAVSDTRFDVYSSSSGNQLGVELVGVYLQPEGSPAHVAYAYQGGDLATEAANWVAAAQTAYAAQVRDIKIDELGPGNTLCGLLIERKLADLLYARGVITNAWVSLFKGRSADKDMEGVSIRDLQGLEAAGSGGEAAYHLPTLVSSLSGATNTTELMELTQDVYDICSNYGRSTNHVGQYPLPVDVLRSFLYTGTLHSNYLAQASIPPAEVSAAFTEATEMLNAVSARTSGSFTLEVRADSFDAACPVLYTAGNVAKSLYTAAGNPFRFPTTFTLQPGAQVSVDAYTDVTWNQCPGTEPLEVIALNLTAVPVASGADANGNLLPDDYEEMFLVGSGGSATSDLDGDGYSDLQEYLEQTDPANALDSPAVAVADFSPPVVRISTPLAGQALLDIDWPAAYADSFVFTVVQSTNLATTAFAESMELPRGALSGNVDVSAGDAGFYRVELRLR